MKSGRKKFLIGLIIAATVSFSACYTTNKVSNQNIVGAYKNDEYALHPEFTLLHVNDSVSQLYFKINENELLYERKTLADSFSAGVRVFCRVTMNYESPITIDSNSTVLNFESSFNTKKEFAVGSVMLKLNRSARYLLTVSTFDLQSKRSNVTYIDANKMNFLTKQNFLVRDPANGHIFFSPWFDTNMHIDIQYFHPSYKLYVHFYRNKFPIASPPFSIDDYDAPALVADSSFSISSKNGIFPLYLKSKGMYHITADSTDMEGLTLFRFDDSYPRITEAYQMVTPLRYISSNEEFEKLTSSQNPKQVVDNFWLTSSDGSKDRARELIRNYYNRIEDANRFFTSYQEGWKTDRGMIYLIFGPPTSIFRSSEGETWIYGEERGYMTLSFSFIRLDDPFSDNDYALQREAAFRNLWYNAVDQWRQGRVY